MSNMPFDQQIINPLERPTSSALNEGFGQYSTQALALSLYQSITAVPGGGSTGFVSGSFSLTQGPTATQVFMGRGVGFASGPIAFNLNGIAGLNDAFDYKPFYTNARTLNVAGTCSPGYIRRDLVMIKPKVVLTNAVATDIYNPAVNSFSTETKFHALSRDFSTETQYTLAAGVLPTADQYLVYKKGVEILASSAPDGFLDAVIPTVDPGYIPIAAINVSDAVPVAGYTQLEINDLRPILVPRGIATLAGFAEVGSTPSGGSYLNGNYLNNVALYNDLATPCCILKDNAGNTQNKYILVIPRGGNTLRASGAINVRNATLLTDIANYSLGASACITSIRNVVIDSAAQAQLLDPAQTTPIMPLAVGQAVTLVTFVIGVPRYFPSSPYPTLMNWDTTQPVFARIAGVSDPTVYVDFNISLTTVA